MPETILDYKASVPSSVTGGITPIAITAAPGVQLADLGIFITPPVPASNRIELKGTVGLQALTGTPTVILRIFQLVNGAGPGLQIFNTEQTLESAAIPLPGEIFYTLSFHMIDFNVSSSTGFIQYVLTAELGAGGTANVVGPITFTGLAVDSLD